MTITNKQHLEADKWLEEQAGGCVHTNIKPKKWEDGVESGVSPYCPDCKTWSPPAFRARSKDLGAMWNLADKLGFIVYADTPFNYDTMEGCYHLTVFEKNGDSHRGLDGYAYIKDHPSPQHAVAWAIYLALREAKK